MSTTAFGNPVVPEVYWMLIESSRSSAASASSSASLATASPSDKTMSKQIESGAIAEGVLDRIGDHPAGHHYVIHAYDSPRFAEQALAVARNYSRVAPEVPHALHMPTHIFTRLGLAFRAVIADTGAIGGSGSHEFHVLADSGEDAIAFSTDSDYAANVEMAVAVAPGAARRAAGSAGSDARTSSIHSSDGSTTTRSAWPGSHSIVPEAGWCARAPAATART